MNNGNKANLNRVMIFKQKKGTLSLRTGKNLTLTFMRCIVLKKKLDRSNNLKNNQMLLKKGQKIKKANNSNLYSTTNVKKANKNKKWLIL